MRRTALVLGLAAFPDQVEGTGDVDGDGIPNYLDPDDSTVSVQSSSWSSLKEKYRR